LAQITINELKDRLNQAGLKVTHPRLVIYSELIKHHIHPTADQLYEKIKEDHPSIAKGTVYRILDSLVAAGLVNQVSTQEGLKRYDANLGEHSHIYCTQTHEIQDYYNPELNELIKKFFEVKKIENFSITDIKLQINGKKINPKKKVKIK